MPAITLGLTEVEKRLHALRRRLNAVTAQHCVYVCVSIAMAVLSALIILALRGSAAAFRAATWSGGILCLVVSVWGWLTMRRRWLDVAATAQLADRRGGLTDRLITLVDLQARPRPARLAPVLVAQLLALSTQWQPQQIAPRRVPRSVWALLTSLLALGSTALIERRPPLPSPAQAGAGAAVASTAAAAKAGFAAGDDSVQPSGDLSMPGLPAPGDLAQNSSGAGRTAMTGAPRDAAPQAAAPGAGELGEGSRAPAESRAGDGTAGNRQAPAQSGGPLTALPDSLQDAIRRAFHAEPMDRPQELAARSEPSPHDLAPREDQQDSQERARRAATDSGKDPANPQNSQKNAAPGSQAAAGKPKSGGQRGQRQDGHSANQTFEGNSPAAGEGSSPEGVLGAKAVSAGGDEGATKTFKLTITSFLRAMEQKGNQPRQSGKKSGAGGSGSASGATQVALSERQLNDDALRKAEIPPEYEEIVRRVYSLRADQ
ncbi:MAG TPA: hypothetical protein VMW56_25090 [Candidatus Margulisiibacteriota bacterium]|nr:hypothetical protein [Candidatus Margulisiibacteriota bacterium]